MDHKVTWDHKVDGELDIHCLDVGQTCTCKSQHACLSCQGQDESLRASNKALLGALGNVQGHAERTRGSYAAILEDHVKSLKRVLATIESEARAAIKKERP